MGLESGAIIPRPDGALPSTPAGPVMCGFERCPAIPGEFALFARTCCTAVENTCGVEVDKCHPFNQPGVLDPNCPDVTLQVVDPRTGMPLSDSFKGCCRPDNRCGLDMGLGGKTHMLGCVRRTAVFFASLNDIACTLVNPGDAGVDGAQGDAALDASQEAGTPDAATGDATLVVPDAGVRDAVVPDAQ